MYAGKISDETRRAVEEMVTRVVSRELATTSVVRAVGESGEFDQAYLEWLEGIDTVVQSVPDLAATQEMPCWVEEDLIYTMGTAS